MPNVKAIVGEKLGMTQIFAEDGRVVPVTVVQAGPCTVVQIRTPEKDGYSAVQIGFEDLKESKVTKPVKGHFAKANATPTRHLIEVRTDDASTYELGSTYTCERFAAGEYVDVSGVSKGKGFAGVMKRWNFHGLRASHGTERKHRSPGSVGAGTTPGRVFKGMKGPGHLGFDKTTVLNLEVVESDPERNLLMIKGAVPGPNGSIVVIRNAVKKGAKA